MALGGLENATSNYATKSHLIPFYLQKMEYAVNASMKCAEKDDAKMSNLLRSLSKSEHQLIAAKKKVASFRTITGTGSVAEVLSPEGKVRCSQNTSDDSNDIQTDGTSTKQLSEMNTVEDSSDNEQEKTIKGAEAGRLMTAGKTDNGANGDCPGELECDYELSGIPQPNAVKSSKSQVGLSDGNKSVPPLQSKGDTSTTMQNSVSSSRSVANVNCRAAQKPQNATHVNASNVEKSPVDGKLGSGENNNLSKERGATTAVKPNKDCNTNGSEKKCFQNPRDITPDCKADQSMACQGQGNVSTSQRDNSERVISHKRSSAATTPDPTAVPHKIRKSFSKL